MPTRIEFTGEYASLMRDYVAFRQNLGFVMPGSATNSPVGCSALSGFKSPGDPWKSNSPVAGAVVFMVVREGLEPPARGFSVPCSTN